MRPLYLLFVLMVPVSGCSSPDSVSVNSTPSPESWERSVQKQIAAGKQPDVRPDPGSPDKSRSLSTPSSLKLEKVIRMALERNQKLKSARRAWRAARHRADAVSGWPDPMLKFTYMEEEIVSRNGPIENTTMLSQKIPWFGKLDAKQKAALAAAGRASAQYRAARLAVRNRVTDAFAGYYFYHHAIEIVEENIQLVERLENSARTKYENGAVERQDLLKVQIERDRLRTERADLRDLKQAERVNINKLLDRPAGAPLGTPILRMDLFLPSTDRLRERALEHRPELAAARFRVLRARHRVRGAELAYYPDVTVGANYSSIERIGLPGTTDSGQDAYGVSLMINLPLWQGKRNARFRQWTQKRRAARRSFAELKNRTTSRVSTLLTRLQTVLRRKAFLEEDVIPKAEQALRSSESGYRNDQVDILDLLDSERSLLSFRRSLYRTIRKFYSKKSELEQLVGGRIREEDTN